MPPRDQLEYRLKRWERTDVNHNLDGLDQTLVHRIRQSEFLLGDIGSKSHQPTLIDLQISRRQGADNTSTSRVVVVGAYQADDLPVTS